MKKIPQDIVGQTAILKFKKGTLWPVRKYKAWQFLKNHKNIKTVVEKTDKFSGELRIQKVKHLAGEKTYEVEHKENGYTLRYNINETYFSPRLSNERRIISEEVEKLAKNNSRILVCFAGVAPYPIAIAKQLKRHKKKATIISNELNADACLHAKKNTEINKVKDYITVVCDDARNLYKDFAPVAKHESDKKKTSRSNHKVSDDKKFDIILMPRPNLEDTFLKDILKVAKKGTIIFYHGFGTEEKVLNEIKRDTKGKIGKIDIRKAGDIGPNAYRWQATFKVK